MKQFLLVDLSLNEAVSDWDYFYDAIDAMKELSSENSHEYRIVQGLSS